MSEAGTNNTASEGENVVQAGAVHGDVHVHAAGGSQSAGVVPHQLPAPSRHFVDRTVEQDALTTLAKGLGTDNSVVVSVIDGLAGVGKSTLVVQWAHQLRGQFPDGELYVNLRGFDPAADPMPAAEALEEFLMALGVAPDALPNSEDARASRFRSLVHGREMLLVLDNARDTAQVLPLLPGSAGCMVVVTSRVRLDELGAHYGVHRLQLATLASSESRSLLTRYLGSERLDAEPDAIESFLGHCAGLPLALTLVAVQAAAEPDIPLAELVAGLRDERERLDALDAGGRTGVRAVFSWSYHLLSDAAARMFRLLGLPSCPDVSLTTASVLAGIEQRECRRILAELTRAHVLIRRAGDRYEFHDLLRAYARERAYAEDLEEERFEALLRLLDHYFDATHAATRLVEPGRALPELDDVDEQLAREFASAEQALEWWDIEHTNVLATIRHAVTLGMSRGPWLAHVASHLFQIRGMLDELVAGCTVGIDSAVTSGDRAVQARLLFNLGTTHYFQREFEQALQYEHPAVELFAELREVGWEARTRRAVGEVFLAQGRYSAAAAAQRHVIEMLDDTEDAIAIAIRAGSHAILGLALVHLEEFDDALANLHLSLDGGIDDAGVGYALSNLGFAHLRAGQPNEAVDAYRQGAEKCRSIGDSYIEAICLDGLGSALHATGDTEGARGTWHQALAFFDEIGNPQADDVRAQLNNLDTETEFLSFESAEGTDVDHGEVP